MSISYRPLRMSDIGINEIGASDICGLTMLIGDRVIATGGLCRIRGRFWTFALIEPEGRIAMRLHRLVLRGLAAAEESGITPVYGYCDLTKPRARDWIERIGFRPMGEDEKDDDVRDVERRIGGHPAWIRELSSGD